MKKIKQKQNKKTTQTIESARRYQQMKNFEAAEYLYRKIVREQPNNSQANFGLAFVLQEKGVIDESVTYYRQALKFNPQHVEAAYNLGGILQQRGELEEAMRCYEKAVEINPRLALAYNNLGSIVQQKGRFDEAINFYRTALQHSPDLVSVHNNLGLAYQEKGQFQEAMECHQKALSLAPHHPAVHFNIGVLLLMQGDYEKGWKEYEWRKKMDGYHSRGFTQPMWEGSDISGRTILLYSEKGYEGFGDTIQFIRYAPLIAERDARVIVECREKLKPLARTVRGVEQVVSCGERLPEFDLHCPYLSLPLAFKTTIDNIPLKTPYLAADAALVRSWRDRISQDKSGLKIGLVWSGDLRHPRSQYRSCSLGQFMPLSDIGDVALYSLQKGDGAEEAHHPPDGMRIFDFTRDIADFSDAAALAENLDLIISVDTAAAHLAGALGKPVWTLLPFVPEWRWMLDRDDSPWYPTMRIFRQQRPGDWDSVISRIAGELQSIISSEE